MSTKLLFICNICNEYLKEPMSLPCHCTICKHHLDVSKGKIECHTCNEIHSIPHDGIKENKLVRKIMEEGGHLPEEEKNAKTNILKRLESIEELYNQYILKETEFDKIHSTHFQNLEQSINERCVQLKAKLDEIASDMIGRLKASKNIYEEQKFLNRPYSKLEDLHCFLNKFKTPTPHYKQVTKINFELDSVLAMIKARMVEIDSWRAGLDGYQLTEFKCEKKLLKPYFGSLKHHEVKMDLIKSEQCLNEIVFEKSTPSNTEFTSQNLDNFQMETNRDESFKRVNGVLNNKLPTATLLNRNDLNNDSNEIVETRRPKKSLNQHQRENLENVFKTTHHPDMNMISELSKKLKLSSITIKTWFGNKRACLKKRFSRTTNFRQIGARHKKTQKQIDELEKVFERNKFPTKNCARRISEKIGLTEMSVYQWFVNTRAKRGISKKGSVFHPINLKREFS